MKEEWFNNLLKEERLEEQFKESIDDRGGGRFIFDDLQSIEASNKSNHEIAEIKQYYFEIVAKFALAKLNKYHAYLHEVISKMSIQKSILSKSDEFIKLEEISRIIGAASYILSNGDLFLDKYNEMEELGDTYIHRVPFNPKQFGYTGKATYEVAEDPMDVFYNLSCVTEYDKHKHFKNCGFVVVNKEIEVIELDNDFKYTNIPIQNEINDNDKIIWVGKQKDLARVLLFVLKLPEFTDKYSSNGVLDLVQFVADLKDIIGIYDNWNSLLSQMKKEIGYNCEKIIEIEKEELVKRISKKTNTSIESISKNNLPVFGIARTTLLILPYLKKFLL